MTLFDALSPSAPSTPEATGGESATTSAPPSTAAQAPQSSVPMSQRIIDGDLAPTLTSSKVDSRGGSEGPKAFVKKSGARTAGSTDEETWAESDVSRTLNGMGQAGTNGAIAVTAFAQNQREELRDLGDLSSTLNAQPGTHQDTRLATAGAVRRLTPTECERLQSFPEGWTAGIR
jgi:site-specific DNA-cytosine methylase